MSQLEDLISLLVKLSNMEFQLMETPMSIEQEEQQELIEPVRP